MNFDSRIKRASRFEKMLFEQIEKMGFTVAINGTEHTHPAFTAGLRRSTDQTSLAIRFQPDGVAHIGSVPRSFYVEAKDSDAIEKTAYEQYKKLGDMGNVVVIVFKPFRMKWCFIEEMPLEDGHVTVAPFPINKRWPVDNDGWLCQRKGTGHTIYGSGTPHKRIIENGLRKWESFHTDIIARLKKP